MMMTMTITPLYAGPLALLFLILSLRVIGRRRMLQVGLGDGGDGRGGGCCCGRCCF